MDGDPAGGRLHVYTGGRHQLLGVGPGRRRFDDGGRPIGRQAGEEYAALHLGAGHRGPILDAVEAATSDGQRCTVSTIGTVHRGSHGPERLDDPVHGPTPDRPVAVEDRYEGHPGQHPGQQPDPRPRIAHIERSFDRLKAPAMHLQAVGHRTVNVGTECFDNGPGVGHVVAVA